MQNDMDRKNNIFYGSEKLNLDYQRQLQALFLGNSILLAQIALTDDKKDNGVTPEFDLLSDDLCEV